MLAAYRDRLARATALAATPVRASSPREVRALSLLVVGCWGLLMLVVGALWATAVFGLSLAGR